MTRSFNRVSTRKTRIKSILLVTAAMVWGQSAFAQAPEEQPSDGDIVVTAQRRSESIQKVPASISAVSGDSLELKRITNFADLPTLVPNLQTTQGIGGSAVNYIIRGISLSSSAPNQEGPIAVYYDEVYKGAPPLQGVNLFDIERVEVLRGPQGTLYGKNASGGAINFISRRPGPETEGYLTLGYGNYDRKEANGALQLPLGDKLFARVAFTRVAADGYVKNLTPGQPDPNSTRYWGVRGSLLFEASDDLELLLRVSASKQNPRNFSLYDTILPAGPGVCFGFGFGIGCGFYAPGYTRDHLSRRQVEQNYTPRYVHKTEAVALTANWKVSDGITLTSITSYDHGKLEAAQDADGSPLRIFEIPTLNTKMKQFSEDFRITTDTASPFNFILGSYYNRQTSPSTSEYYYDAGAGPICDPLLLAGCRTINRFNQIKTTFAIYSDATLELSDRLKLHGGLRYTNDKGRVEDYNADYFNADGSTALITIVDGEAGYTVNNVSGKVGLDFQITPDHLLYAGYSRGFRGSAFASAAFDNVAQIQPSEKETVESWEAGFKTQWLDRAVTMNGSVFYYNYRNQQAVNVVNGLTFIVGIPKSRLWGAELELTLRPLDNVRINGGLGYTNSKMQEGVISGVSLVGNQVPQSAKWNLTSGIEWDALDGASGKLTIGADISYRTKVYFDIFNTDRISQDGYALVNAQIRYTEPSGKVTVSAWARNLTNRFFLTNEYDVAFQGFDEGTVGDPRTYGATVQFSF